MIRIPNNKIAVEPLKTTSVEVTGSKGFVTAKQKNELICLTVVYPALYGYATEAAMYQPGDRVYIRGDEVTKPFMHEKFDLGGKTVSLIPISIIQAHDTGLIEKPTFAPVPGEFKGEF